MCIRDRKKTYIEAEKEKLDAVLGDIDQSGSKTPVILYPLLHLSMDLSLIHI